MLLAILLVLILGGSAQGVMVVYTLEFDSGFANGGVVPDGNLNGWADARVLKGLTENVIADVNVRLDLAGGWNGDLYAYLTHDTGFAVLLNRVGRSASQPMGYGDAGFGPAAQGVSFTLDDQADHNVHVYQESGYALNDQGQLEGSWQPDGREIDPRSKGSAFDTAMSISGFDGFIGMDMNGMWTLYLADVVAGGDASVIRSWELEVTAIPELNLLAPGLLTLLYAMVRRGRRR